MGSMESAPRPDEMTGQEGADHQDPADEHHLLLRAVRQGRFSPFSSTSAGRTASLS